MTTHLDNALENLRTTVTRARAIDATQSVVNINEVGAVLHEIARLRAKLEELTDRVCADIHTKSDNEDLRRELDAMRREWAAVPTAEEATAKLRNQMREWFPKYEVGAIQVAMPAAVAMRLLDQLDEWRTQVDTLLTREAEHTGLIP